jgi:cell division protein FtsI/penicillin-binding protein 2
MRVRRRRKPPGAPTGVARWRMIVLFGAWILVFALLFVRMVDLQVVRAGSLARLAMRQQIESIQIPGRRGLIVDRMGRPLAVNVEVESIYAVPRAIGEPSAFGRRVGPALGLSPADIVAHLRRGGPYFAWLARRVPAATGRAVRELGAAGSIGVLPESRREYPAGTIAASVVGFTGMDDGGLAGLELQYDHVLRGAGGLAVADRDAIGRTLVQTQRVITPPRDGDTLVVTLDEVIQHIAERELGRALSDTRARSGVAIVMDPQTGEILAMAGLPTFDPGHYQGAPPALWKSHAVADVYEPGSTFKLILAAAALSSHAVTLADRFTDPGQIRINGATIHDAEPNEHFESLGLGDIVKYSSNVGAAQVATRVGTPVFSGYIHRFGFGRPTGIDLPGETPGIIRPTSKWLGPSLQNIGFGQGISVTPIQILVAVSSLATHGLAVHPHVVEVIRDPGGHPVATPGEVPPIRVIEQEVADQVFAMMRDVVHSGTGVKAQIPGYAVAGKTGTAQRPSPSGGYEPGGYVASFVGIVPADAPRLAILVIVDGPHGAYFGGDVAAPVFREIARQVLWYLRVPPRAIAGLEEGAPPAGSRAPGQMSGPPP